MSVTDPWLPPDPVPLDRDAVPIAVYRIGSTLELMDSLRVMSIMWREGPVPRVCMLRYAFDGFDPNSPQSVEQALDTAYTLSKTVKPEDRLAVRAWKPDGTPVWIFDGYPFTFSMQVDDDSEHVVIACLGREHRAWDNPIKGALFRDSKDPETVKDVETDVVIQFNPKGQPNASPSNADAGSVVSGKYPTQMDPGRTGTDATKEAYPRTFTLPMAVAHLLYRFNDETKVLNPMRTGLNDLLVSREPIAGVAYDPTNSSTYTAKDIQAPDTPISDRSWPGVVHDLIKDSGFGMRFPILNLSNGRPFLKLDLFLKSAGTVKPLYLPARYNDLDPATCNVESADLSRDLTSVVNQWTVRGGLVRYEVSFVLAPAFPMAVGDASTLDLYSESDPNFVANVYNAYRTWTFNEGGDTYYPNGTTTATTTIPSLDSVLGAPVDGVAQYVNRRRAPIGRLFSADSLGNPLRASLSISTDYTGVSGYPRIWDNVLDSASHWQPVAGEWELLKDRIGIRITSDNPNDWKIGKSTDANAAFPGGVVNVVEGMNSAAGLVPIFLRLTCVIEADKGISYTASVNATAALSYPIERVVDARDRIQKWWLTKNSQFNTTAPTFSMRDDTDLATAEAIASRTATDNGVFEGSVVIPRFTGYYEIGDRISRIAGRDLGLRTDNGGTKYAPVYPSVMAIQWDLDGVQTTTLTLSDAGLDRARKGVARHRQKESAYDREKKQEKARQVAKLAHEIQAAGFGANQSRGNFGGAGPMVP